MTLRLQGGELLAAQVGAAARHHHGGVPAQDAGAAAESVQPPEFLLQLLIGRQRHEDPAEKGAHSSNRRRLAELAMR